MAVDDGIKNWDHESVNIPLFKSFPQQECFEEFSALHELNHQTVMALVLIGVDQLDDVRMVNRGQYLDLVLHADDVFRCHLSLR